MIFLQHPIKNDQSSSGFALIVVILILLLVTVLAAELTFAVRVGTLEGFNIRQRLVGRALAHAGINQSIFSEFDTPINIDDDQINYWGKEMQGSLETGRFTYVLVNESGKIDLNGAELQLITIFAEHIGLEDDEVAILTDSIVDWRDPDSAHGLNGAEDDYYQDLEPPYRARNGKFLDAGELNLVRGAEKIGDMIKISEIFTVYNSTGKINFNSLTPAMLAFLTEEDPEKIDTYHELSEERPGKLAAGDAQIILGNERYQQLADFLVYTDNNVRYYTTTATGYAGADAEDALDDRPGTRVTVLFEKNGLNVNYYGWQEEWS